MQSTVPPPLPPLPPLPPVPPVPPLPLVLLPPPVPPVPLVDAFVDADMPVDEEVVIVSVPPAPSIWLRSTAATSSHPSELVRAHNHTRTKGAARLMRIPRVVRGQSSAPME